MGVESLLGGKWIGQANRMEPTSNETVSAATYGRELRSGTGTCRRSVSESALKRAFCMVGPCSCPTRRVMGGLAQGRPSSFLHRSRWAVHIRS
jgi:hypothetical protein